MNTLSSVGPENHPLPSASIGRHRHWSQDSLTALHDRYNKSYSRRKDELSRFYSVEASTEFAPVLNSLDPDRAWVLARQQCRTSSHAVSLDTCLCRTDQLREQLLGHLRDQVLLSNAVRPIDILCYYQACLRAAALELVLFAFNVYGELPPLCVAQPDEEEVPVSTQARATHKQKMVVSALAELFDDRLTSKRMTSVNKMAQETSAYLLTRRPQSRMGFGISTIRDGFYGLWEDVLAPGQEWTTDVERWRAAVAAYDLRAKQDSVAAAVGAA